MTAEEQNNNLERALGRLEGKMDLMVGSVNNLASSFENLEKGRLSRLEVQFAELSTNVTIRARNAAMITAAVITVVTSLAVAFLSGFIV